MAAAVSLAGGLFNPVEKHGLSKEVKACDFCAAGSMHSLAKHCLAIIERLAWRQPRYP